MFIIIELSSKMEPELQEELGAKLVGSESFKAPNPRYNENRYWYRISYAEEIRFAHTPSGQRVVIKKGSHAYAWETSGAHIEAGGYGWPFGSITRLS